jgi:DNA recombination-dependent growth factor C
MWFKNLQIYRLPTPWNIDLAKFEEQLARGPFVKLSEQSAAEPRLGLAAPGWGAGLLA